MEKRIADFFKRNHIKPHKPFVWNGETNYYGMNDDDIIAIKVAENHIVVSFLDYERIRKKYEPIVIAEFGKPYETIRLGYRHLFIRGEL